MWTGQRPVHSVFCGSSKKGTIIINKLTWPAYTSIIKRLAMPQVGDESLLQSETQNAIKKIASFDGFLKANNMK